MRKGWQIRAAAVDVVTVVVAVVAAEADVGADGESSVRNHSKLFFVFVRGTHTQENTYANHLRPVFRSSRRTQ